MNKGEIVASDGWVMKWDLELQQIDVHNASGVPQYTESGGIDQKVLLKKVKRFQTEHAGQLEMTLSIPMGPIQETI